MLAKEFEYRGHIVDKGVSLTGSGSARRFRRFNTQTGVVAVVSEERRDASCFRLHRVGGKLSVQEPVYLVVLKVGDVGAKVLFEHSIYPFGLAITLGSISYCELRIKLESFGEVFLECINKTDISVGYYRSGNTV